MIKPLYTSKYRILTNRHVELLAKVAEGMSYKEIAKELGLKETTLKSHFQNIRKRLGVENNIGAIFEAIYLGYLEIGGV